MHNDSCVRTEDNEEFDLPLFRRSCLSGRHLRCLAIFAIGTTLALATFLQLPAASAKFSVYGLQGPPPITIYFESDRQLDADGMHFGNQITDPLDYAIVGSVEATPGMVRQILLGGYKTNQPIHRFASFDELASAARSEAAGKTLVIFVHGCCTNFPLATAQAASLAENTGATVFMYDWGSPLASYGGSLLTYPRSQERFKTGSRLPHSIRSDIRTLLTRPLARYSASLWNRSSRACDILLRSSSDIWSINCG